MTESVLVDGRSSPVTTSRPHPLVLVTAAPYTGSGSLWDAIVDIYDTDEVIRENHAVSYTWPEGLIEEVAKIPIEVLAKTKALVGHCCHVGMHEFLPVECEYLTILRDPVAVQLSHYYAHLTQQGALAEILHKYKVTLEDFVQEFKGNAQAKFLLGRSYRRYSDAPVDGARYLQSLFDANFAPVVIAKDMDLSLAVLKRHYGWDRLPVWAVFTHTRSADLSNLPEWAQEQVKNRPKVDEMSDSLRDRIRAVNQIDVRIYEACVERRERDLQELSDADLEEVRERTEQDRVEYVTDPDGTIHTGRVQRDK